ncbi:MAG: divalent-cation tolerance protein CutA, partial [Bdellovibrionales bacterium]|nr:divalent-cation tolerance protein CutA [Bdellovibrionales bacterium]
MTTPLRIVFVTVPDREAATTIARRLVEERLAACVNIVPEIQSIFRWNGTVTEEAEVLLKIKTLDDRTSELEARIVELHPYTTPEV